jgi:tRNA pseudouridine55 synthase
MSVDGILNVNKPAGWTSFDVVARLRKLSGEKRVGHAGTLDPMATGVLPICFGQATRTVEYLMTSPKEYLAVIELGASTDTYDGEGTITRHGDISGISLLHVEETLKSFEGIIEQIPPVYSALKHHGKRYCDLARAGHFVHPLPRSVNIEKVELLKFINPILEIRIRCKQGTYIRSIANDLGEKLSCGAYLKNLARSSYGPFSLENSFELDAVEQAIINGTWHNLLSPLDLTMAYCPIVVLNTMQSQKIIKGLDIEVSSESDSPCQLCRAYDSQQRFIAVLKFCGDSGLWHPEKVFKVQ